MIISIGRCGKHEPRLAFQMFLINLHKEPISDFLLELLRVSGFILPDAALKQGKNAKVRKMW